MLLIGSTSAAVVVVDFHLIRWCEAENEKEKKMNKKQWHETFQQRCFTKSHNYEYEDDGYD